MARSAPRHDRDAGGPADLLAAKAALRQDVWTAMRAAKVARFPGAAGRITLPIPEPHREYLRSIRRGERPLAEVLAAVSEAEARLAQLRDSASLPDQPDRGWVDSWLHRSYLDFWASSR